MAGKEPAKSGWDAETVRALRRHLGVTQEALAEELGTRQQTVSEWETGLYAPRGMSSKLLSILAERADFRYGEAKGDDGRQQGKRRGRPRSGA